jgi:hypothetical protein
VTIDVVQAIRRFKETITGVVPTLLLSPTHSAVPRKASTPRKKTFCHDPSRIARAARKDLPLNTVKSSQVRNLRDVPPFSPSQILRYEAC